MQCRNCHYSLENLTENRCPECGRAFDPNDPTTFNVPRAEYPVQAWLALLAGFAVVLTGLVILGLVASSM